MADTRAYISYIDPNGTGADEDNSVHQTSPAWVLTFVRWSNRDTLRVKSVSYTDVREPLVVESDCIQLSTSTAKSAMTPSVTATLVMSDVNYETAVFPGDFLIVNMLNFEADARRVADKARAKTSINKVNDGFKGIFKVQSVRRKVITDINEGTNTVLFTITGYAFTEFNNTIYFNPYLVDPNRDTQNQLLFASYLGRDWQNLINAKGLTNVQDIISVLIQSFIGSGISDTGRTDKNGTLKSPNVHFYMPQLVGALLGNNSVKAAKDIYNYIFGIQKYSAGENQNLASGMNPAGLVDKGGRFFYTATPCAGDSLVKPEFWNQVKAWSIINQYTNAPLNELYTCFRVAPNGHVMPTLVFRQIPFTSEDFTLSKEAVTKFMNLPRWKVAPALIYDQDIGREESARINFVQYFGRSSLGVNGSDIAQEIAQGNYLYDVDDVQRSGLRPYIITTQFDEPTIASKKLYKSPEWAKIMGDSVIGSHAKMNGTIITAGIAQPIAVGDNLEFDGIVYHIESISHTCTYTNGKKQFRSSIALSSGVAVSSSTKGTRYAEMTYTNADDKRAQDFNHNQILPGISESQDTVYRPNNLDEPASASGPFVQPGGSSRKSGKGDDNG